MLVNVGVGHVDYVSAARSMKSLASMKRVSFDGAKFVIPHHDIH